MMRPVRLLLLSVLLACARIPTAAAQGIADDAAIRVTLVDALRYETPRRERQSNWTDTQTLELDLTRRGGEWEAEVWGFTPQLPGQEHPGKVTRAEPTPTGWRFDIDLTINHNRERPLSLGGPVSITLTLEQIDGSYHGTYTAKSTSTNHEQTHRKLEEAWGMGTAPDARDWQQPLIANRLSAFLLDATTRGKATATARPMRDLTPTEGLRFAADGHPRLLLSKADLNTLRQRAATPQGQAIMQELATLLDRAHTHGFGYHFPKATHSMGPNWAIGHGLLYQLTGDKKHAEQAKAWCTGELFSPYYYGGGWLHAYTLQGLAVSYDLCHDAWDEDFRNMVFAYLEKNIRDLAQRDDGLDLLNTGRYYTFANDQSGFNLRSAGDSGGIKFRAAAATAALALLKDSPPVFKPTPLDRVRLIEPTTDYEPWLGVPVNPYEDDVMPRHWLTNGPFKHGSTDEIVKAWGGWDKLRPEPGDRVAVDGVSLDWRPYDPAGQHGPNPTIYMRDCGRFWTSSTGKGFPPGKALVSQWSTDAGKRVGYQFILYTVIDNDEERVVQAMPNWKSHSAGCRMWINGQPVRDGDLVRLLPGLYTMAVDVRPTGGYANQSPRLRDYTQQDYTRDAQRFELADKTFHDNMRENYTRLMRSVLRYVDAQVGADGWGGWETHETLLPLLTMHQHVTGDNLAAGTGLEHLTGIAVRLRGHERARTLDYMVSQSAALMPSESQGVARWYMDRHGLGIARPLDALMALVTHPLEAEATHPAQTYKLAHTYESHGVVTFNSGLEGADDVLVRLHAASGPLASIYSFGVLEIDGAGHAWTDLSGHHVGEAHTGSTLTVRDTFPAGPGRLTHAQFQPDGSGSATVVLDKFTGGKFGERGEYQPDGRDARIELARAVQVDYSGTSGADAVILVADRWTRVGGKEKAWRMRLGRVNVITDPTDKLSPGLRFFKPGEGSGFDLTLGRDRERNTRPATMRVTFFSESELHLATAAYGDQNTGRRVDLTIDRVLSQKEKLDQQREKGGNPLASDRELDSLLDDLQLDSTQHPQAGDTPTKPTRLLAVITIQRDGRPHPQATLTRDKDAATLKLGQRVYRYADDHLRAVD